MNVNRDHNDANQSCPGMTHRGSRIANQVSSYGLRDRWRIPDPPAPTAVLCVDLREGRFETTEQLIDLILELDDRMRECDHMMILSGASPSHRDALSDPGLTNAQIRA